MNSKTANLLKELTDAALSSLFDPNPVHFKPEHEKGVSSLRKLLDNPSSPTQIQKLPRKMVRNAFLCGCLDYTDNEPVEHLIIGYGAKRGIGTDIHSVRHTVGNKGSVKMPQSVIDEIITHSIKAPNSQIIIFHNHPYNWLNSIFDNIPLASTTDRMTILRQKYLDPFQFMRNLVGIGGLRFYLGENGFVREIKTPSVIKIAQMLKQSTPQNQTDIL